MATTKAPNPVVDLNWSPERAEKWGTGAVALWKEFLEALPKLPVSRRWKDIDVRGKLALEIPDEPLSDEAVTRHLREVMFDLSMYPGHPRFMAFITGPGTIRQCARIMTVGLVVCSIGRGGKARYDHER